MAKRQDDETAPLTEARVAPAPTATGWSAATEVYKFVCSGCNAEKRQQKMLAGKCEACWSKP